MCNNNARGRSILSGGKRASFEEARENSRILNLFGIQFQYKEVSRKILSDIPKSAEFPYSDVMDKIVELVMQDNPAKFPSAAREIDFHTLLERLHVPSVHYNGTCNEECTQKIVCGRIRDVIQLLNQILSKMSEQFPIFKDVSTILVGSLKEQTKTKDWRY